MTRDQRDDEAFARTLLASSRCADRPPPGAGARAYAAVTRRGAVMTPLERHLSAAAGRGLGLAVAICCALTIVRPSTDTRAPFAQGSGGATPGAGDFTAPAGTLPRSMTEAGSGRF